MGGKMNKKTSKYFYILLIFLIIININAISASEIDQGTDAISEQALADDAGMDEVSSADDIDGINLEIDEISENNAIHASDSESILQNIETVESTSATAETVESTSAAAETDHPEKNKPLKKTYLYSTNYAIKSEYFKVQLKDESKKVIPNKKIVLTINGKNLSATTNSDGIARFKINEAGKSYRVNIKFNGSDEYRASNKTFILRVIENPIYTKLSIAEHGIIMNKTLHIYLKTKDGKALSNQNISITINGGTYYRTTDSNGLAMLKLNKKAGLYTVSIKYPGKGRHIASTKTSKINVLYCKTLGKTSYGRVEFLGVIGNRSSKVRIAYVVGLHYLEHQIHESVYDLMKNKVNMKYKYYIYRIVLTKKSGDYSTIRMRGQKLAKKYIVPHAKKQKYNLVIDIHSTTGVSYAKTYFIHVPKNKHKPSMKLAKKTIKTIQSIESNSKMVYWSPQSQTSPPYIHLPLIEAGTPTFVFETWTYEKKSKSDKRAKILITAVDKIFG